MRKSQEALKDEEAGWGRVPGRGGTGPAGLEKKGAEVERVKACQPEEGPGEGHFRGQKGGSTDRRPGIERNTKEPSGRRPQGSLASKARV